MRGTVGYMNWCPGAKSGRALRSGLCCRDESGCMWRNSGGKQDLKPAVDGLPWRCASVNGMRLEGVGQRGMARLTELG